VELIDEHKNCNFSVQSSIPNTANETGRCKLLPADILQKGSSQMFSSFVIHMPDDTYYDTASLNAIPA
jgi:hypothetical protein